MSLIMHGDGNRQMAAGQLCPLSAGVSLLLKSGKTGSLKREQQSLLPTVGLFSARSPCPVDQHSNSDTFQTKRARF